MPPKEDMNLIYSVIENIIVDDKVQQKILRYDDDKATKRSKMTTIAIFRESWRLFYQRYRLDQDLPINLEMAKLSAIEPRLRGKKVTDPQFNILFGVLENLREKVRANWAKVAERAGLRNADEAQEAWGKLCAAYQIWNGEGRAPETPDGLPPLPRRFVAKKDRHANHALVAWDGFLTASNTQTSKNHPAKHQAGKCCPSKAFGFEVVARNLLRKSKLAEGDVEEEDWESMAGLSIHGRVNHSPAKSYDTPTEANNKSDNLSRINPKATLTPTTKGTPTGKGIRGSRTTKDAGIQKAGPDPCCYITDFGYRVALVYLYVILNGPTESEKEDDPGWPLSHLEAGANNASSASSSSSSSSSSSPNPSPNSRFSSTSKSSTTTTATTTSNFHTPTKGTKSTGTHPSSPTRKEAEILFQAARYMWSLAAQAEHENDNSLTLPGWLLSELEDGGASMGVAEPEKMPLSVLWERVVATAKTRGIGFQGFQLF